MGSCRRKLEAVQRQVQEKWGDLTDDDLDRISGKRDQLIGQIQTRYGIAKDQAVGRSRDIQ